MKYYSLVLAALISLKISAKPSDNIFTVFFKEYPEANQNLENKEINKNIKAGIVTTNVGYMTISDKDGQIILPRSSQKNSIRIVVTKNIKPIFQIKKIIKYWQLSEPAEMYTFSKKLNKETHLYYWSVKKNSLPKNNHIPLHTMVILADPKYIYIPEGIKPTSKDSQLFLPDIYVKDGIDTVENAIFAMNIRQHFSPILKLHTNIPKGYLTLIKPLTSS